jgi:hypothetical protein
MAGSEILRTIGGAATVESAELIAKAEMLVGVPDISR